MASTFWEQVKANGLKVPEGRTLPELTTELTRMLGDPDPANRDGIAYPTLATWISQGVYDELLKGLGDGMATGLDVGLGEDGTDSVFRRSFSALVLAEGIERDNVAHLVPVDTLLGWGDHLASWFVRERDLRGYVPTKGWAHTVAHGADALGRLAEAGVMGRRLELTVLLDVIADRLLVPTATTSSTARTTGWRWPPCGSCAATWSTSTCSSPGSPGWPATPARTASGTRTLPGQRQRAALPARALPPGRAGPEPAGRTDRTCCSC